MNSRQLKYEVGQTVIRSIEQYQHIKKNGVVEYAKVHVREPVVIKKIYTEVKRHLRLVNLGITERGDRVSYGNDGNMFLELEYVFLVQKGSYHWMKIYEEQIEPTK